MKEVLRNFIKVAKQVADPYIGPFAQPEACMFQRKHCLLVGNKEDKFCFGELLAKGAKMFVGQVLNEYSEIRDEEWVQNSVHLQRRIMALDLRVIFCPGYRFPPILPLMSN